MKTEKKMIGCTGSLGGSITAVQCCILRVSTLELES